MSDWKTTCYECKWYKEGNYWGNLGECGECKHPPNYKYSCYGYREGGWLSARWNKRCGKEARFFQSKTLKLVWSR